MRRSWLALLPILFALPAAAEEIGSVGYRFKWLGPNDKIVVEAFDDPDLPGITCYLARARTGGLKGMVGLAEDPPYASISSHQVGPVDGDKAEKLKSSPFRIGVGVGGYGSNGGAGVGASSSGVKNVIEGSLILRAIDPTRNAEVWNGSVSRELGKGSVDPGLVNSAVADLLHDFPAHAGPH